MTDADKKVIKHLLRQRTRAYDRLSKAEKAMNAAFIGLIEIDQQVKKYTERLMKEATNDKKAREPATVKD